MKNKGSKAMLRLVKKFEENETERRHFHSLLPHFPPHTMWQTVKCYIELRWNCATGLYMIWHDTGLECSQNEIQIFIVL